VRQFYRVFTVICSDLLKPFPHVNLPHIISQQAVRQDYSVALTYSKFAERQVIVLIHLGSLRRMIACCHVKYEMAVTVAICFNVLICNDHNYVNHDSMNGHFETMKVHLWTPTYVIFHCFVVIFR